MLGVGYKDESVNYTSFLFLEDDMVVTWEALVAWAKDTEILEPYRLKRSFFRAEIRSDSGKTMYQDFQKKNHEFGVRYVLIPSSTGNNSSRRFVQLKPITYSAMFIASRAQLGRYMKANEWSQATSNQCCTPGGKEYASWGFQFFEVRNNFMLEQLW